MTTATRVRILLLIALPPLLAAAASIVGMLLTPDLPETLAVHWGFDGSVDRTDGLGSYIGIVAGLVAGFTAGAIGFSVTPLREGTSRLFVRSVIGMATWFGVFISLAMYLGVQTQRGVTDVESLPVSTLVVPLAIGFGVAVVVAAVMVLLAPDVPVLKRPTTETTLELADGEEAYWASTVRSPRGFVFVPIGFVTLIVVLFTVLGLPVWLTVLVALPLASLVTMVAWRVVVDRRGLTVTGLLGFPRFHVPLENVASATSTVVNAFTEFGGWGVRLGRSGGWGVIVRTGEAIEVDRHKGAPFVVTVDDAATGAGLLTSLARRVSS
jgi:hypothetical protein